MNVHAPMSSSRRRIFNEPDFPLFCGVILVLVIALTLGGASRLNMVQVTLVELASLPLLIMSLLAFQARSLWQGVKIPLVLIGIALLIPLAQLVPLPPGLWAALPGHKVAADALATAGIAPRWRPASLAPDQTLISLLALCPPVAVFLAVFALQSRFRRWVGGAIVAVALVSIMIGALQVAGAGDRLNFYGRGEGFATGFFSNRNHQSAFLVCAIPLIAYLISAPVGEARAWSWPWPEYWCWWQAW